MLLRGNGQIRGRDPRADTPSRGGNQSVPPAYRMWHSYENLPLRHVEYPRAWYGAFPAFREVSDGSVYFCECQRQAILNCLDLWPPGTHCYNDVRTGFKLPDTQDFPKAFSRNLPPGVELSDDVFLSALRFKEALCHVCNRRVPHSWPSFPRSTPPFTLFSSYFRKLSFQHGVSFQLAQILEDKCSPAIRELVPYHPLIYRKVTDSWKSHWNHLGERNNIWRQYIDPLATLFHKELLSSLGFPSRGPRLVSETILYSRAVSAFSPHEVIRHHRPKGFRGLSLDIFVPDLSIAIEYQGAQHYEALEHWGGEKALASNRERDARKARLCKDADIRLIYFDGNVTFISEDQIRLAATETPKTRKRGKD